MRITNYEYIAKKGKFPDEITLATVDIETGILWWKKKEKKKVFREAGSARWRFLDSGEIIMVYTINNMEAAFNANSLADSL